MKIIRNIIVSFSLYSRIPMPHFEWKEEDTKYAIGFIWLVGVVIGATEYGLIYLCNCFEVPVFVQTLLWSVMPLIITGGFHVDGFMDVMDATNSYRSREEKLKILKDPHIGAFAVISFAIYGGLYVAATYTLLNAGKFEYIIIACGCFAFIRGIGALLSVVLKHAKKDGMLHAETKETNTITKIILIISIVALAFCMVFIDICVSGAILVVILIYILYFIYKCNREFGGISGDTIGYFITEGELIVMCVLAVFTYIQIPVI